MIITLSGLPGAGKSTLKNDLAEHFHLKKYSVGDLRGKMAEARGLTIDEFNKLGETEAFTDKDADEYQKKLGETEDNFVIDGRLSWYFIPKSIKIFLNVEPRKAAERIFADRKINDKRSDEPNYQTVEEAETAIKDRLLSDQARYKKWYGIDFLDLSHYDLVLETTPMSAQDALQAVLDFLKSRGEANI
jgi:predicted cytidylate kinase